MRTALNIPWLKPAAYRLLALSALSLLIMLAPSSTSCAADPGWVRPVSFIAGTDARSAQEAIQLVRDGQGGLALARLQGARTSRKSSLSTVRSLSAWMLLEVAGSLGVLSAPDRA